MAEAAGLAVGTIALASLFQTCLDILDYIEDARNIKSDRERGDTKLGLLKIRLKQWGDDLQVLYPGREDGGLREHWPEESGTISKSLLGITGMLNDASKLSHKYAPYRIKLNSWYIVWKPSKRIYKPDQQEISEKQICQGLTSLTQRTTWAFRDKKRFNSLLAELDFFVTNLEKVTIRVVRFDKLELESLSTSEGDFKMNGIHTLADFQKESTRKTVFENSAGRTISGRVPTSGTVSKEVPEKTSNATQSAEGHTFKNNSAKDNGFQHAGDHGKVDPNAKRHEFTGHQAEGNSMQFMGNMDGDASKNLFQLALSRHTASAHYSKN
ncbi:prion-inhibition and propagation-domain-containing protein [Truncatella angustata]|uniref:Prion-inhibition and propagation-domain-containing protein n=1 Tax=Truncatella angustata TaxID=152316 RepID=A0A9P9A0W8_9PEZI|nr:prion-inhibition and propagation-domain-containing protein [Truncatella angustata]KAH6656541.1 prion-inhibition and propagation-domain-containing protein [Truncatella angustata]